MLSKIFLINYNNYIKKNCSLPTIVKDFDNKTNYEIIIYNPITNKKEIYKKYKVYSI